MNLLLIPLLAFSVALISQSVVAQSAPAPSVAKTSRAVVLVSGGAIRSPFTTPTQACKDGDGFLAAGNTNTALRRYLLDQGKQVYTAPAMDDWGTVQNAASGSVGPHTDCPPQPPEVMTILSTGDWNAGGERLARFLGHLNSQYGVTDVDVVTHSNGGMWARAAIKVLKDTRSSISVRSLTTISAPHTGAFPPRYFAGEVPLAACEGNAFCEQTVKGWVNLVNAVDKGLSALNTVRYTSGPKGWNAAQGDALRGIPVTLIAGTYFEAARGASDLWPYDGTVPRHSAWAVNVSSDVIPWRTCWSAPLVHWIGQSEALGIPWDRALTHNPDALARVNRAIDEADTALQRPDRQGCQ